MTTSKSILPGGVSAARSEIRQARLDLAVALRWAARLELSEGVDNHFSMAIPDRNGVVDGKLFLINPYGWHWSEVTASSLVLCDHEGTVLEGENSVETSAFMIHSRLHLAHPGATVILHTHMPYATALTLLQEGRLEMCEQNALMYHNRIAYDDDYNGLALDTREGDRMAEKMGRHTILFLASHGVIVTGPNVAQAFTDLYYLERAAMFQVLARSTGRPLRRIDPDVVEKTSAQFQEEIPMLGERYFTALGRMLDAQEHDYRN